MRHLLLSISAFILLNCSTKIQENEQKNSETTSKPENENSTVELQPQDSSFNSFLVAFCSNEEFQLTRINFPFKVKLIDIEDNEEIIKISNEEWKHWNLLDTAGIKTREYNAFSQTTEVLENSATIQVRGIDNGIWIDFTFELRDGRWYLTEKTDSST